MPTWQNVIKRESTPFCLLSTVTGSSNIQARIIQASVTGGCLMNMSAICLMAIKTVSTNYVIRLG